MVKKHNNIYEVLLCAKSLTPQEKKKNPMRKELYYLHSTDEMAPDPGLKSMLISHSGIIYKTYYNLDLQQQRMQLLEDK